MYYNENMSNFKRTYLENYNDLEHALKTKNAPMFMNFPNFNKNGNFFSHYSLILSSIVYFCSWKFQIVIIVSDGHSRDDPVAAANRLRQSGVRVLALGIGPHINVEELVAIAGTPEFVFQNLTDENSFQRFMETFEKFTMGEQCEFARGSHFSVASYSWLTLYKVSATWRIG